LHAQPTHLLTGDPSDRHGTQDRIGHRRRFRGSEYPARDIGRVHLERPGRGGSPAFGAQKTVVILVNFTDKATQPYTNATARNLVLNTSNFDLEELLRPDWLTGDVFGWYTIAQADRLRHEHDGHPGQGGGHGGWRKTWPITTFVLFPDNACPWVGTGDGRRHPVHGFRQR
jgi:hypothetical protein